MTTQEKKQNKRAVEWSYPVGGRPAYFGQRGAEFTKRQREFVESFFFAPPASHVPGLDVESDGDMQDNKKVSYLYGDGSLANPNYRLMCMFASGIIWSGKWDVIQEAVNTCGIRTLKVIFRTFEPAKSKHGLEGYVVFIFRRFLKKWNAARVKQQRGEGTSTDGEYPLPAMQGPDFGEVLSLPRINGKPMIDPKASWLEDASADSWHARARREPPARFQYIYDRLSESQHATLRKIRHGFRDLRKSKPEAEWIDLAEHLASRDAWLAMTDHQRKRTVNNLRKEHSRLIHRIIKIGADFDHGRGKPFGG